MSEHIGGFIKIAGRAHLTPRTDFTMCTLAEILISQCTQDLNFLTVPNLSKTLIISITQHNAVAAIAGVVNAICVEIYAMLTYFAYLGFRMAAFR